MFSNAADGFTAASIFTPAKSEFGFAEPVPPMFSSSATTMTDCM